VLYERITARAGADLEGLRGRTEAVRARVSEESAAVSELAAGWTTRLGQPLGLPAIEWPRGDDPFSPPTLLKPQA